MSRLPPLLAVLLIALPGTPSATAGGTVVHETDHYALTVEGGEETASEFGRVLEAAWPKWQAFFGAEPELREGRKLRVVFANTQSGFDARLRADGIAPPKAGGYYSPGNRTAYFWRQPTPWFTRTLLLHETTHQFHYLAKTGNRSLPTTWYVEGTAEYLSRHYWDGEKLVLGVLPLASLEDYPAAALKALRGDRVDLVDLFEARVFHRPVSFALLRYFCTGEEGRLKRKLDRLSVKLDRGTKSSSLLFRTFGSPAKLRARLLAWLEVEQEPLAQIFNTWEGIGPDRVRGHAPGAIVSACRRKGPSRRFGAILEVPAEGAWNGGLLLHHSGPDDYTVALVRPGRRVRVDRRRNGRWEILAEAACPEPAKGGEFRLEAVRGPEGVLFRVEGKDFGPFDLPGSALGLALQGSDLRFRDVTWE